MELNIMGAFVLVVAFFVLALIIANQGGKREIGFFPSFFISLFFTPLIGILIVLASDKKKRGSRQELNESGSIFGEAKQFYDSARTDYLGGNFSSAVNNLKVANGLQPNSPLVLIGLAHNYAKMGNCDESMDYIERAVETGYTNFKRIQTHDDFRSLRVTKDFEEFVKNGYRKN